MDDDRQTHDPKDVADPKDDAKDGQKGNDLPKADVVKEDSSSSELQAPIDGRPLSALSVSSAVSLSPMPSSSMPSPPRRAPRTFGSIARAVAGHSPDRAVSRSSQAPSSRSLARSRTGETDDTFDSTYDDDFLPEERAFRPCWRTLHAVFVLAYAGRKVKANGKFNPLAGHADNFRTEDGYVLKALTMNEAAILESLSREASMRPFAPQFMGCVEREGRTFIKMQDVLLSMSEPNFMDIKMGLRTFAESEVGSDKRRMDLLKKALAIQQKNPNVYITDDEKENGISKYRFMSLRDHASSSATLGFRVQGVMKDTKALTSKDFASHRSVVALRSLFRSFFERASPEQRHGLLERLMGLHAAASNSEWFARHEIIGSSLLVGYDTRNPAKFGIWMIDFARTEPCPIRLAHTKAWKLGTREDGYLLGVQSLIKIWSDEARGDIALHAPDWHYRAEGHDSLVIGYHGTTPALQGKVLRLAKEPSMLRHRDSVTGHPATAYNDFVTTMLAGYLGPAADAGHVVFVPRPFLEAMAERVEPLRPEFRAKLAKIDLDSEYQLLLDDASYVAGAERSATIAVELRLKMGHLAVPSLTTHWIKSLTTRFAMMQHLKLQQEATGKLSGYCPLDLFSGDFDRIHNVLLRLLDSPQNNLRVFYGDAVVVPQTEGRASSVESGRGILDHRLAALLGGADLPPAEYLSDLVAKCLVRPTAPGGVPLVRKIQNLQRLGLDVETLWPFVKKEVQGLQQIYHHDPLDVRACAEALPPLPSLYCHSAQQRARRGLPAPSVDALRHHYLAAQRERAAEAQGLEARLESVDHMLEARKLLLSQSLKACSLMVALAAAPLPAEGAPDPGGPDTETVVGVDGRRWRFVLRLLDMDAKSLDQLPRWHDLDCAVVKEYLRAVFGAEWEQAAQLPPGGAPERTGGTAAAENGPASLLAAIGTVPALTQTPIKLEEVDRILGLLSPRPLMADLTPEALGPEVEALVRYPDRLPDLTDRQIDELLGLLPSNAYAPTRLPSK